MRRQTRGGGRYDVGSASATHRLARRPERKKRGGARGPGQGRRGRSAGRVGSAVGWRRRGEGATWERWVTVAGVEEGGMDPRWHALCTKSRTRGDVEGGRRRGSFTRVRVALELLVEREQTGANIWDARRDSHVMVTTRVWVDFAWHAGEHGSSLGPFKKPRRTSWRVLSVETAGECVFERHV